MGKTTAAAATAVRSARAGRRTLVVSTDPAHSLADALAVALPGGSPVAVEPCLDGMQVDAQGRFETVWHQVQGYLLAVLDRAGVDPIEAEELTVLPGADEVLALLAVRDQVESGRYELVVVDCAPTAETLRLLALPDALDWYMRRIWPTERRVVRTLRPVLSRVAGVPMPTDAVFDAVERLHHELAGVRAVLGDPGRTSVRLVLTPEAVVVAEARRTLTTLSLYGYRVDGVVANRLFPGGDPWRDRWVEAQGRQLAEVGESFAPLPLLRVGYQPDEPIGVDALARLGEEMYAELDPSTLPPGPPAVAVERTEEGFVMTLALPLAERSGTTLVRKGDELAVTVGGWRRLVALPSALRRCDVSGARLEAGALEIEFVPDPSVWMSS